VYTKFVILFLSILPVYFLLDAFLCVKVFLRFYDASVEAVKDKLRPSGIATYLFTVLLLLLVVIVPALERASFLYAFWGGALFGAVVQVIFRFLRNFHGNEANNDADAPIYIDIVRGVLLGSVVSSLGYGIGILFDMTVVFFSLEP
jgi:uncharacterized membrane protein